MLKKIVACFIFASFLPLTNAETQAQEPASAPASIPTSVPTQPTHTQSTVLEPLASALDPAQFIVENTRKNALEAPPVGNDSIECIALRKETIRWGTWAAGLGVAAGAMSGLTTVPQGKGGQITMGLLSAGISVGLGATSFRYGAALQEMRRHCAAK